MRNIFSWRHPYLPWLLTVVSLLHAGWVYAADEAAELLKLVGSDASLCVEAVGLKDALPRLRASEMAVRVEKSPLFQQWQAGKDYANILKFRSGVERIAGANLDVLLQELFGRAVVLVVYAEDRPRPVGVLLTQASSPEVVRTVIASWNAAERQQSVAREFGGQTYFARAKAGRDGSTIESAYYVLFDAIAAISDNEDEIRRVITLRGAGQGRSAEVAPRSTDSLWSTSTYRAARESLAEGTTVAAYLNPRHWDAALKVEQGLNGPDTLSRLIAGVWHRSQSIVAGVRFDDGVALEVVAQFKPQSPSKENSESTAISPAKPDFLTRIPREALLAVAGLFDFQSVAKLFTQTATASMGRPWDGYRQMARGLCLGLDVVSDILPQLGPNWGFYVVPNPEDQTLVAPVQAVFACQISTADATKQGDKPSVRQGLENALTTGLNFWAALHNSSAPERAAVVRTGDRDGVSVKWIDGMDYHQPAYAFAGNYLVLASSPRAIMDFAKLDLAQSLVSLPVYQEWSRRYFKDDNQTVFINIAQIRRLISERQKTLATQIAAAHRLSSVEVQARLAGWQELLQLFDGAFLAGHVRPERAHVVFGGAVSH